jgi:hypothetical protein
VLVQTLDGLTARYRDELALLERLIAHRRARV